MSIAAQARARAEAAARKKAEADAESAAAAQAKARPAKIKPALRPAPSVPDINPNRVSPAAQRRRFLIASSAGAVLAASGVALDLGGDNDDTPLSPEASKVVLQLQEDRRRLKEFKATGRKVEAKVAMLPAYRGWCDGVLAAGQGERGPLDQIFTTIMAWTIDVGDYMTALPMLEHAVKYKLDMPGGFERDAITFAIDQICEEAIRVYDLGGDAAKRFEAGVLPMLQDMVDEHDIDLHDEVEAKLFKAIGRAIMAGGDLENEDDLRQRREQTLKAYQRALELHERCGVKKDIERLNRELKKAAGDPAAPGDNPPPPSGG